MYPLHELIIEQKVNLEIVVPVSGYWHTAIVNRLVRWD